MYYITPITENPYVKEHIKTMLADTINDASPIRQHKNSNKHRICIGIEIFLFMLFLLNILAGFYFLLHNMNMEIYHFVNEDIIPIIYLVALIALSVYKEYPNLMIMKISFYSRIYIFFLTYTAFCNILTSYNFNYYFLFVITGFGLAILYLGYFIHTSSQALDSFLETTTQPATHLKM
jgi:hypothetical protein